MGYVYDNKTYDTPSDEFYELKNGLFNMLVTLFMDMSKTHGRAWAKEQSIAYLENLKESMKEIEE